MASARASLQSLAIPSDLSAASLATAASFPTSSAMTWASAASFSTIILYFATSSALITSLGFKSSR
jgi:hypothetical protein